MGFERPRAILFDWDNTLVETWPTIHAALFETFTAMGVPPWTLDETKTRVRLSMRESFPILFGDRWTEARDVFYDAYGRLHLSSLVASDGATELLSALHDSGFYLGVISNKTGNYLRAEAAHLGWDGYFGRLVGAGDAARDKPSPEPVAMALDGSGILPGNAVWMIGDSGVDMEIAHATGLISVLIGADRAGMTEFEKCPPHRQVADCRALLKLLRDS